MSYMWNMFGVNTLEIIGVGLGRGREFDNQPLESREGPKIRSNETGGRDRKVLYLYPEHLEMLYARFRGANPKGVMFGPGDLFYQKYAPPELAADEALRLESEGKIFVHIFCEDAHLGYPRVKEYLPELFELGMVEKMSADPWLNVHLLGKAIREGYVPTSLMQSARWSPEWRAYCDRLIASGEYK